MSSRYEDLLLPEHHDSTIGRVVDALKSDGQLSPKTLNNVKRVLQRGKPIPGFNKDPIKAPIPALKQQLAERLNNVPGFAHILLEVWAETEPQLRDVVAEHLDALDPKVYEKDETDDEFWDAQVSLLADKHCSYNEDDILMMVKFCYGLAKQKATKAAEAGSDDASEEIDTIDTASSSLSDVIERLRTLPAESAAWQGDIPKFIEDLNALMSAKEDERNLLNRLLEDFERFQNVFTSYLEFFGRRDDDWDIVNLATSDDIVEATRLLSELETAFEDYQSIQETAATLVEERERRKKRDELEDGIERILADIDALSANTDTPGDHPTAGAFLRSDEPHTEAERRLNSAAEVQIQAQSEAYSQLQDELEAVKGARDSLLSSERALNQENVSLLDNNRALEGEVAGLNADKQTLEEEAEELRDQLRISAKQELYWRQMYETEMSNKNLFAPEPFPSEIGSIKQALTLAEERYGESLLIRLNKKSDPDYAYNRPKEVWDALEWLAETYYKTQTGEKRVVDLNESIRNTCSGWEYMPNQTDITVNTFSEWYTTTVDGVKYELRKHIGKGRGNARPSNIVRIAFAWDYQLRRVIVGYIGPHQRNRTS